MRAEQEEHRLGDGKVGLRGSLWEGNYSCRINPSQRQARRQTGDMEEPPGCKTLPLVHAGSTETHHTTCNLTANLSPGQEHV